MSFDFDELRKIFLHLFFPVNCPVCGKFAEIICNDCVKSLFAEKVIIKQVENLDIISASWYHTVINQIISEFKYYGVRSLCKPVGRAMAEFFTENQREPKNIDYIVPVPLHLKSKRFYNQALEISKGMSEIWNIKIFEGCEWSKVIPNRAGLNSEERKKLQSDVFAIPENIKGLKIIIVDDVCTTGLTLAKFSEAIKNSGGNVICAYTLASVSG